MEDTDTTTASADADTGAAATDTDTTAAAPAAETPPPPPPPPADEPHPFPSSPSSSSAPSTPPPNPQPTATPPSFLEGVLTLALPAPNAPPPVPPAISPSSAAAHRRIPPPCWTHEETLALIDAYGAKWAALRRGNLRTAHWEEVAGDLQARTADLPGAKPKTAMQCRHKIEKLRKRYRSERQRSLKSRPGAPPKSSWVYFRRMDALEFGAGPNPGLAPAPCRQAKRGGSDEEDGVPSLSEEDDEEEDGDGAGNHPGIRDPVPKANGIGNGPSPLRIRIPRATRTNRTGGVTSEEAAAAAAPAPSRTSFPSLLSISSNGRTRFLGKFPGSRPQFLHTETSSRRWEGSGAERYNKKGKRAREEEEDQEPVRGSTNSILEKVVAAVRMLGDGFMRMEQMKMDMAREFERTRMDMELKHTEMMLQSQRRILDFMIKGITGSKKRKMPPEP